MKVYHQNIKTRSHELQVSINTDVTLLNVNDGESGTSDFDAAEPTFDVRLQKAGVTGLQSVAYTLNESQMSIHLQDLKEGENILRVTAKYGNFTKSVVYLHILVSEEYPNTQSKEFDFAVLSAVGDGTGESDLQRAKSMTYSQLKALKDAGGLVAGQMYRITDYVTTTAADDTQSAGHAFDLIVTALDAHTLDKKAHAIQHDGDTYFADCDLAAWEIWYTIENDADHYDWADTENGKGVIYRLIDEWRNDYPYDFKNIMFKRWAVTGLSHSNPNVDVTNLASVLVYDEGTQDIRYGIQGENYTQGNLTFEVEDATDFAYYYALSWIAEDGDVQDASIVGQTLPNDEGLISGVYGNSCGVLSNGANNENTRFSLPNNTIISSYSYEGGIFYGISSNTFGNNCSSNTFGNYCYYNTFGNDCYSNTFGNDCYSNTFGNNCSYNTFGNNCYYNTFGNNCSYNTFGNNCYYNTFGNNCSYNMFGNNCYYNTFGNNCYYNTFGNNCSSNTFGNDCYSNTFGNYCYSNTFGNRSQNDVVLKDYMRYITLEAGVQYVDITCAETTSDSAYGQNILVHSGVVGTGDARKTCSIDDAGNDFLTEFGTVVQGTIS